MKHLYTIAAALAAASVAAAGSFEYAIDDGDSDTAQGPPSTFDPDTLWGNYFEAQPGTERITSISVAFGPTFPTVGEVKLWLFDDPDDDFDPRNAVPLTTATFTPTTIGGDVFSTVEIDPTVVSGGFFVAANAFLMGGEDRPQAVDTSHPGDRSWFFYDPEIDDVANDLSSAAFGTRMDNPEFVVFPGAFLIRANGEPIPGPAAAAPLAALALATRRRR